MTDAQIARINELAGKSKTVGLTDEERVEQANLRSEYLNTIRANMKAQLDSIKIKNPDGSITDVKKRHDAKYGK